MSAPVQESSENPAAEPVFEQPAFSDEETDCDCPEGMFVGKFWFGAKTIKFIVAILLGCIIFLGILLGMMRAENTRLEQRNEHLSMQAVRFDILMRRAYLHPSSRLCGGSEVNISGDENRPYYCLSQDKYDQLLRQAEIKLQRHLARGKTAYKAWLSQQGMAPQTKYARTIAARAYICQLEDTSTAGSLYAATQARISKSVVDVEVAGRTLTVEGYDPDMVSCEGMTAYQPSPQGAKGPKVLPKDPVVKDPSEP